MDGVIGFVCMADVKGGVEGLERALAASRMRLIPDAAAGADGVCIGTGGEAIFHGDPD